MRKWFTLLAGALFAGAALAADITEAQARTVAENFVAKDAIALRTLPDRTVDTVTQRGGLYLVTLKPSGYLFVSANRSARPIPTFSEYDFVEPEEGSPLAALLATAETNSVNATGSKYATQWKTLLGEKVLRLKTSSTTDYVNIDPMVTSSWSQGYPYNELTPIINGSHTLVGCVATAYSQVLRFWQWPERLDEDIATEHSVDGMWGHKWRLKAGTEFEWQDMPLSGGYDNATRLKLGRGAMFAGMLARMTYNTKASGTQTSRPGVNRWYTDYKVLDTSNSTLAEREAGMKASLQAGCPFMVSVDYAGIGHAVVGDGWQESSSGTYVHLNYGWGYNNSYYGTTTPLGVYLNQKPRPMVMNKPMPTHAQLPLTVEWSFPKNGYDTTLTGFDVTYTEVSDTATDWCDDMSGEGTGTIEGDCISVEMVDATEHGNVMRIGTKADEASYTWPTMVATANTVFSYDIHSKEALGMTVEVQLLDPSVGWITLATPEISERSEIEWKNYSFNLSDYADKGIAIRVKATRTGSSSYNDDNARATGVQFDNIKLTNVRSSTKTVVGTKTAAKADRSYSIDDSALKTGKMYLFQVTPTFNDNTIVGIPGYAASCTIVAAENTQPTITSVESVSDAAPKMQNGMYRECYFGRNQFGVYGSSAMTKLEAYLSNLSVIGEVEEEDATQPGTMITAHNKVSIENAVTVAKKANGQFLVTVDVSNLTTYLNYTGMILTLVGRNDAGDAVQKDVCLRFTKSGSETAIAATDLPEAGTISGGSGDTPSTPVTTTYTVTFATLGGTSVSAMSVTSGSAIGTLPSTTRDGYAFLGWFTEYSGGEMVSAQTIITANTILFAHWQDNTPAVTTYTVTFDPNGGSPEMSRFVNEKTAVGTLPTTVTKSGYKLVGWFTEANGGTEISASQIVTGNITYYAHWEVSSGGGTGGGSTDTDTTRFCSGVTDKAGAYDVTRSGTYNTVTPVSYNLIFWWVDRYYEANGQNPSNYTAPSTSSIPDNGSWTIQSYTAHLLDSALPTTLSAGSEREQYFPSVEYTPEEWYGSATGDGRVKAIGRKIYEALANGPIGIRVRTSTGYVAGAVIWGCDYATEGDVKYATKLRITDTTLSKDVKLVQRDLGNYTTTDGYYSGVGLKSFNSSNNGIIESFYPITGPAGTSQPDDPVVVTTRKVTFDADGGTDVDSISVEDGTALSTLPTTSKSGYTFLGWFNGSYQLTTATQISADVTYTAKWEQIETPDDPDPDEPSEPDDPVVIDDDPIGVAINDKDPGNDYTSTYKYEMYDNYWTARKRAIKEGKQLFILSGAAWCSNCAFVKKYLTSLGDDFKNKFVVYYADHDSTVCQCFQGGLPQYGVADPRTVDAFTGTLNGTTRSWDLAWQTDTSGIYQQDRGGYAADRVEKVVNAGSTAAKYDYPTNLVLRGLSTLGTGKTGRYELYAQFEDGVEMPVDYGVEWSVLSGDGTFADANVDGRDIGALTVNSGSVVIRARSTFYFTGTKTMTVDCAPETDIVSVEILTDEVNLEDDSAPTIEAQATLKSGKKIPVFGFGTWEATFDHRIDRSDPELEENSEAALNPTITVDDESRLNYALSENGLLEVCDQVINLTLTVNGQSHTKQITVWGPTKVIPSAWTMLSAATQTTPGVVRLSCTELKYNYGGEIKKTSDSYFASYEIVLKNGIYSQTSHLRGLTVYVNDPNNSREYKVGLKARKVNGKYTGYLPTNPEEIATAPTVSCIARGADKTTIEKGLVPAGYFTAFFPTRNDYDKLAEEDYDKDGFKNWEEYVLGTDPTNAGDTFALMQGYQHLSAPASKGDTMQYKVMYTQRAGRIYYIDGKKDWNDDWTQVASVSLADMDENDVTSFTYPKNDSATFADACKFFRVRAALNEHDFSYPDTKPIIAPNMLVAAPDSIIDLSASNITATAILKLTSFDTDATDAGMVYVKVPAGAKAGDLLISAPKSAQTSLEACKPYESGDVEFEVVEDPDDATRMMLKVKGDPNQIDVPEGTIYIIGAASFGEKVFSGAGTIKMAQTSTAGKANLKDLLTAANFADDFTGTIELGAGRYVYSANCVPSNVKISVEDGAQLFVSDGVTIANAVTIAGNGWGGETQYAVSKAALRLGNNAVLSGTLTVASDAKIGVHDGNTGSLNGVVSGSGTLTKWAGGTLLLSKATSSNFTGRFVVGQGTAKANTGSVNFFGCNTDAKAIIVEKGATFDMNGKHSADLTICLNGGTLTNTGTGITSGKKTIRKIVLTDDSTLSGSQNYGLIASNYVESFLDLQGHTLTFAMTSGKDFWMPNTTATNGTIVVQSGRFYPWHAGSSKTSRYYCTMRLEGGEFKVQGNSTVDTLVLAGGSITDTYTLTIVKGIAVEKTTIISRAITLGDDATVSLAAGTSLTVNTQIAADTFTLPPKCRLITTQSGSTYTYTCRKKAGTMFFVR